MAGVVGRSVAVEVVAECPRCHSANALSGAVDSYRCPVCTEPVALPARWWDRVLFRAVAESLTLPEGKGRTARIRIVPGARLLYGPYRPRCPACREPLPVEDLMGRLGEGTEHTFCPDCGGPVEMRPTPPVLRDVHPLLAAVVGEHPAAPGVVSGLAPRWYLLLRVGEDSAPD